MGNYDANGNYQIDPADFEDSEALANADRAGAAIKLRNDQAALKNQQAFMQKSWDASLETGEISQAEYSKLVAADPELANEFIRAGMESVVAGMKAGRKSKPAQPGVKPQQVQDPSSTGEVVASAKARANRGESISDSEMNDLLERVVGRL